MKKIIITIMVFVVVTNATAQKNKSWSFSVNAGIASPSGNLTKTDYSDNSSGFVSTGLHLNVSAVYHISKSFGINMLAGYSQFAHAGSVNLSDGYKEDSGTDSTTLYKKGHTGTFSVLIGPYLTFPLGKKLNLNLRAVGGYVNASLAGFQVFYEENTDNSMTQNKSTASSFGFQLGGGLSYTLNDKISILANADYFNAKPTFNVTYQNFVVNSGRRLSTYNESFSGINATVGIGFRL